MFSFICSLDSAFVLLLTHKYKVSFLFGRMILICKAIYHLFLYIYCEWRIKVIFSSPSEFLCFLTTGNKTNWFYYLHQFLRLIQRSFGHFFITLLCLFFSQKERYSGTPTFYVTTPSDGARGLNLPWPQASEQALGSSH